MSLLDYSKTYTPTYPQFVELARNHEAIHWIEDEVNMSSDVQHWKTNRASEAEMSLIRNILRLFTTSDVAVGAGYFDKLIPVIKNNEARNMLASYANREAVHQRAYALLSDTLGFGEDFYLEFLEYQEMFEKYEFMIEPIDDSIEEFVKYLAKQTLIEGVSLFASFAMLFNFDRFGLFPGMVDVVRWSTADEAQHVKGNSALFAQLIVENPHVVNDSFKRDIYDTARHLVDLEDAFIDKAFEFGEVRGVTPEEMKEYVRYIADIRLGQLGFKPNWNISKNPIPWVDELMVDSLSNFFERSVMYDATAIEGSYSDNVYGKYSLQIP